MFAPLMKFKNKECFDKHQIIEFITPNENAIYHIICVAKVKADNSWYSFIKTLFILKFHKWSKHSTVLHIMTVNNEIF